MSVTEAAGLIHNEFVPWAPWNTEPSESRVALVATAGVYLKKGLHEPFREDDPTFREFPAVVLSEDLALAPAPYDQSHARVDVNVVFPLERLRDLAAAGYIGSVAPFAYSFLGRMSSPVALLSNYAPSVAYRMRRMGPDVVLVVAAGAPEHQSAALVARAIELAGVPTVLLGTNWEVLEAVRPPRTVIVGHPEGAPLGNPGNGGKHEHLLRDVLEQAWQFQAPGLTATLGYSWSGV